MNNKYIWMMCYFFFLTNLVFGQERNHISMQWLDYSDGIDWNMVTDMQQATDSSIYILGNYSDTTLIGKERITGDRNVFVARYNPDGEIIWQYQIQSPDYCYATTLELGENRIYIAGYYKGELSIAGEKMRSDKKEQAFILAMDEAGIMQYIQSIEGDFKGTALLLQELDQDQLLVGGSFYKKINLNDSIWDNPYTGRDIFSAFLDKNGEIYEFELMTGKGDDVLNHINTLENGLYIYSLSFEESIMVGETLHVSKGMSDALILARDIRNETVWDRQIGSFYNDFSRKTLADNQGGVVTVGNYSGEINDIEMRIDSCRGGTDIYVARLKSNGDLDWIESFGSNGNDYLEDVQVKSNGGIYVCGSFRGIMYGTEEEECSTNNSKDIFLTKYTLDGDLRYIETIGDSVTDYARNLVIDHNDFIYLTGNFNKSFKVNSEEIEASGKNVFVTKLYDCDEARKISLPNDTTACAEYILLTADSSFSSYHWNGVKGSPELSADTTGMYYLQTVDAYGCISEDSVWVYLPQLPFVDLGEDMIVEQGEQVILKPDLNNVNDLVWNDGSYENQQLIETACLKPGQYLYKIEALGFEKCYSNDSVKLTVVEKTSELDFSVTISPNPAKSNDVVNLLFSNVKEYKICELQIFSLKGELLLSEQIGLDHSITIHSLDIDGYEPGVYYLQVLSENSKLSLTIILI